ncbi:MAG TPA: glycosyltransferase family 4 protein, partial [Candidatus Baltobacteraceae bacterium]|nr:glycosyltransferase family 4 protein [Candidatus Baltobacteraceae bacterium]
MLPFSLAHGGAQVQIEQTKAALEKSGVEVEYLRWWDADQKGDILHFFGPPSLAHIDLAAQKKIKIVVTHLLGGLGVRPAWKRTIQKNIICLAKKTFPHSFLARTGWNTWQTADAYIAITSWEAKLMTGFFQAPSDHVHVIPNGVADFFFESAPQSRNQWLVTTASILPVKRLVETAEAAVAAKTPYWIIGRPFSEQDAYYKKFLALCQQHRDILRYDNVMRTQRELAQIYRQARGFVLLSRWETQSLSALEAAACECPLLLSDLPWAHSTFGEHASYCPIASSTQTAPILKNFYNSAPSLKPSSKPATWNDVAQQLKK